MQASLTDLSSLGGIITPPSLISGDACFAWQLDQDFACRLPDEVPQSFLAPSFETLTATDPATSAPKCRQELCDSKQQLGKQKV